MRPWHEECQAIANLFTDNWDDELLRFNFVDLVLQLSVEQPLKTPFLAAVVLIANADKSEVVDMLLAKLAGLVEKNIGEGEWRDVKLYLKLAACLQGCLSGDGVFPVLEELFNRAVDLQTASSEDVGAFWSFKKARERVLTLGVMTDYWYRDRQDYPPYDSVRHGYWLPRRVDAKGRRPYGKDRDYCC